MILISAWADLMNEETGPEGSSDLSSITEE